MHSTAATKPTRTHRGQWLYSLLPPPRQDSILSTCPVLPHRSQNQLHLIGIYLTVIILLYLLFSAWSRISEPVSSNCSKDPTCTLVLSPFCDPVIWLLDDLVRGLFAFSEPPPCFLCRRHNGPNRGI